MVNVVTRIVIFGCLLAFFTACQANAEEAVQKTITIQEEKSEPAATEALEFLGQSEKHSESCQHFCKIDLEDHKK